jgi:hypothetical protein
MVVIVFLIILPVVVLMGESGEEKGWISKCKT